MRGQQGLRAAGIVAACTAVALTLSAPAWAACNPNIRLTRPDSRYEAVAGAVPAGSEVRDKVTGLVWQRCVLGMAWNGSTCTGGAAGYTWVQALEAARTAAASSAPGADAWRLPDIKELVSLAETACVGPAINSTWFPAEPGGYAWSSSPFAVNADFAWGVYFGNGGPDFGYKGDAMQVRLVRSGQ